MLFTLVTLVLPTIYSQSTLPQTLIKQECKEEEGRFECQNGKCIPDYWLCDGVFDCPDKDDEEHDKCRPQMRGAPPETFSECQKIFFFVFKFYFYRSIVTLRSTLWHFVNFTENSFSQQKFFLFFQIYIVRTRRMPFSPIPMPR